MWSRSFDPYLDREQWCLPTCHMLKWEKIIWHFLFQATASALRPWMSSSSATTKEEGSSLTTTWPAVSNCKLSQVGNAEAGWNNLAVDSHMCLTWADGEIAFGFIPPVIPVVTSEVLWYSESVSQGVVEWALLKSWRFSAVNVYSSCYRELQTERYHAPGICQLPVWRRKSRFLFAADSLQVIQPITKVMMGWRNGEGD